MMRDRNERGPDLAGAGSVRTAWRRSGLWEVGGAPGWRGFRRCALSCCSTLSHGWATSSLLGVFLLSANPAALTSSGCFAQRKRGSKLVPVGLWANGGGRRWASNPLSISLFSPHHQAESSPVLKGRLHARSLSIAFCLSSLASSFAFLMAGAYR